jgi:hypothetical protein
MNESKLYQYGAKMDPSEYQDHLIKQQQKAMQDERFRHQPAAPTPTQPIRLAMNLLDQRINKLQDVCDRLFTTLQQITSQSDEKYPIEKVAREGNSDLNCSLNKMTDRLEEITVALQLQIDRLEV